MCLDFAPSSKIVTVYHAAFHLVRWRKTSRVVLVASGFLFLPLRQSRPLSSPMGRKKAREREAKGSVIRGGNFPSRDDGRRKLRQREKNSSSPLSKVELRCSVGRGGIVLLLLLLCVTALPLCWLEVEEKCTLRVSKDSRSKRALEDLPTLYTAALYSRSSEQAIGFWWLFLNHQQKKIQIPIPLCERY